MQPCGWDDKLGYCVLADCQRSSRCAWRVTVQTGHRLTAPEQRVMQTALRGSVEIVAKGRIKD